MLYSLVTEKALWNKLQTTNYKSMKYQNTRIALSLQLSW
jgi:hypothetical protein